MTAENDSDDQPVEATDIEVDGSGSTAAPAAVPSFSAPTPDPTREFTAEEPGWVGGPPAGELRDDPFGTDDSGEDRSTWQRVVAGSRVFGHGFGAMLDTGMMVMGIGLLSIAVATLLDGFGVAQLSLTDNSGAMFGSALLVGVFGSFALGVANEGPLTSPRQGEHVDLIVTNAVRAGSLLIVAWAIGWVSRLLPEVLTSLPKPFELATTVIEQTGRAAVFFGLFIGVPLAVMLRLWRAETREDADFAIIFVVWLVGTMLLVNRVLPGII